MAQEPNNEIVPSDVEIKTESTELQEINEPQTLVDEITTPAYKPSKKQTNIAYFVAGLVVLSLIIYIAYWKKEDALSLLDDFEDIIEGSKSNYKFLSFGVGFYYLLMTVCYCLIYRLSCNRAVKIATGMGAFLNLLNAIKQVIFLVVYANPDDYSSQTHENVNLAIYIHSAVDSLLWIYIFYLYIKNSSMSTKTRSWVALLAIFQLFDLCYGLANLLAGNLAQRYIDAIVNRPEFLNGDISIVDYFYFSVCFRLYYVFVLLLSVYGSWRLFCSEAFSGNYDEEASTSYSPFNRWLVMAIVSTAVIGAGLYFYYIEFIPENFDVLI